MSRDPEGVHPIKIAEDSTANLTADLSGRWSMRNRWSTQSCRVLRECT